MQISSLLFLIVKQCYDVTNVFESVFYSKAYCYTVWKFVNFGSAFKPGVYQPLVGMHLIS